MSGQTVRDNPDRVRDNGTGQRGVSIDTPVPPHRAALERRDGLMLTAPNGCWSEPGFRHLMVGELRFFVHTEIRGSRRPFTTATRPRAATPASTGARSEVVQNRVSALGAR